MNLLPLLDDLAGDDVVRRDYAEVQLRDLGVDAIRPLFKIHRREKHRLLPDMDLFPLLSGLFIIPFIICVTVAFIQDVNILWGLALGLMVLWMTIWAYKKFIDRRERRLERRKEQAQRRIAEIWRLLENIDDVRAVSPLLDAMGAPHDLSFAPAPFLLRLLPRLKPEDRWVLSVRNRTFLHGFLQPYYAERQPEFVLAILKAMEQIGDVRSAERIRRLSRADATNPTLRRICAATRDSLVVLEARLEQAGRHDVLLRPSTKPDESSLLLYPASVKSQSSTDQLLRATEDTTDRS